MRLVKRFALLAFVLGFGCGHRSAPPPCSASTCLGCCDRRGVCNSGDTVEACGFGAVACQVCVAGEVCGGGSCEQAPLDAGTDGGVPCGLLNCVGCCDAQGVCRAGTEASQCGFFGQACVDCHSDAGCVNNQCACAPENCAGCCDSMGQCRDTANQDSFDCGSGGAACANCGGQCSDGGCVPGTCTAGVCPTCCDAITNNCLPQTTDTQCGNSGFTCINCLPAICRGGFCESPFCNTSSCPTGCCVNNNTCVDPPQQTALQCGSGAGPCQSCGTGICVIGDGGGSCQAIGDGGP